MKKTRKQIVEHFMEDFKKEIANKFPEMDFTTPLYRWLMFQYQFKLERILTTIMIKNKINY